MARVVVFVRIVLVAASEETYVRRQVSCSLCPDSLGVYADNYSRFCFYLYTRISDLASMKDFGLPVLGGEDHVRAGYSESVERNWEDKGRIK